MTSVFLNQHFKVCTQVMGLVALKLMSDLIDSLPFPCTKTSAFELDQDLCYEPDSKLGFETISTWIQKGFQVLAFYNSHTLVLSFLCP